jgi:hypothetical protein
LKLTNKNKMWLGALALLALAAAVVLAVHFLRPPSVAALADDPLASAPLFDPGDKPMKINLKGLDLHTGKWADFPVTIRQSKSRLNQMKQAVLAFGDNSRRLDIPEGISVNEVYLTAQGSAVVDVSTQGLQAGSMGFYEELLFIRGLIETLTKNFSEVKQIKLLVNGMDAPTLAGHYALGTNEAAAPLAQAANSTEDSHGNQ